MRFFSRYFVMSLILLSLTVSDAFAKDSGQQAIVRLRNGNEMSCRILSQNDKEIVVEWMGGRITLGRNEIQAIELDKKIGGSGIVLAKAKAAAAYKNNPVIHLLSGVVLDSAIGKVGPKLVMVKHDLGDGDFAEQDVPREKIDYLEFRPIHNEASDKIEAKLKKQFPKMQFYPMGMVTLVTDTEGSSLKTMKDALRDQQTNLYFEFFDLVKSRTPSVQHYVVVFDKMHDYFEYALTDGVPAWLCPGYFMPTEKTLFLVNFMGDEFSGMLYEVLRSVRDSIDKGLNPIKGVAGNSRERQIDGISSDIKGRFEGVMGYVTSTYADITMTVLRHEFTHEFLHDWGVQTIIVSGMKEKDEGLIKKKKDLINTPDIEKKKTLLLEILKAAHQSETDVKTAADNAWFVEGLAEYASTPVPGEPNTQRLYDLQEAVRKKELWPIEQLTVFRMGSFPGVQTDAKLSAYAQSWSLVDFLMKRYRQGFMAYLDRMARQTPGKGQDLGWLLEALGNKDLRELEKEWHAHIATYPISDDPFIESFDRFRQIMQRS